MDSLGNTIVYFIIVFVIAVFSVLTVTSKKILRAATYLLFVLFATAAIYFQLGYAFLGSVQIAVYAGGIMVLFVFSILLTGKPDDKTAPLTAKKRALGISAAALAAIACVYALISFPKFHGAELFKTSELSMQQIGKLLMGTEKFQYLLPFEAISILLLACIIGGIVVARKR